MSKQSRKRDLLEEKGIGFRLRKLREKLGLSRDSFARKVQTTPKQIERYERNETEAGILFLDKLVEKFKVSPVWLLTGEGPMFLEEQRGEDELDLFLEWLSEKKKTLTPEERYRMLGKLELCFPEFANRLKERKQRK